MHGEYLGDKGTPTLIDRTYVDGVEKKLKGSNDKSDIAALTKFVAHFLAAPFALPFIESKKADPYTNAVYNLAVSECFECARIAIWVYDKLIYPQSRNAPAPNADLPAEILRDYEEASTILNLSPRGAAALLRLAIEKLVTHLGAQGKDINAQIASLVGNGLPEPIQQALDAVRVIGNHAVHPGQIDLRDDRDTAAELFELVNIIADERITRAKRIEAMYAKIPKKAKAAIEERNAKAKKLPKL